MLDVSVTIRLDVTAVDPDHLASLIMYGLNFHPGSLEGRVMAVNVDGWYPLETVITPVDEMTVIRREKNAEIQLPEGP